MKLYHSHHSPFARKVMIVAHERGLVERIELLASKAHPVDRDRTILAHQPLAQVPTLITDSGEMLADSRVICEYLDAIEGHRLFPQDGAERWRALVEQSVADGLMDAALLIRYELTARPETERSAAWMDGQRGKIESVLDWFEARTAALEGRLDIGIISLACALGYLDLRFSDLDWRSRAPGLAAWHKGIGARPSVPATAPPTG